ncbi:MAG: Fic family protein [Deltaproteobacteria bacterium]|nr:Fic family protein [Deltaproteobacteria bacterium]
MRHPYQPPYTITSAILNLAAKISETAGRISALTDAAKALRLRRINRIRTIRGSLAIEGNTLSEKQITAILDGKQVIAPPREVQEVRNAIFAYDCFEQWRPEMEAELMEANRVPALMQDLLQWLSTSDQHPLITSSVFHYEFEFIHPFADGNGRMGRLWQTLILTRWKPLFADIPVESLVHEHQTEYYQALQNSTDQTDSAPFIAFMLRMILDAVSSTTPQVAPQVTPQVERLLDVLEGEKTREELQRAIGLKDRKSFRERYLKPALAEGWIEMTIPGKSNSRLQKYRLTDRGQRQLQEHDGE